MSALWGFNLSESIAATAGKPQDRAYWEVHVVEVQS